MSNTDDITLCPFTCSPLPKSDPLHVAIIWNIAYPHIKSTAAAAATTTTTKTLTSVTPTTITSDTTLGYENDDNDDRSGCGHKCSLLKLIEYLQDGGGGLKKSNNKEQRTSSSSDKRQNDGANHTCPVCHDSPIVSITDEMVLLSTNSKCRISKPEDDDDINDDDDDDDDKNNTEAFDIVSFRYGKVNYHLSVLSNVVKETVIKKKGYFTLAQDRIAYCLGMEVEMGMKVLYRGKVIHPQTKKSTSPEDISSLLLRISHEDVCRKRKKPSLIVMGTRVEQMATANPPPSEEEIERRRRSNESWRAVMLRAFTGGGLLNVFRWLVVTTFSMVRGFAGGVFLFVRSMMVAPAPRRRVEGRDD